LTLKISNYLLSVEHVEMPVAQSGGGTNGQLPISFGALPIEILLFQNCLFIFQ
jgi:hypothetical protein